MRRRWPGNGDGRAIHRYPPPSPLTLEQGERFDLAMHPGGPVEYCAGHRSPNGSEKSGGGQLQTEVGQQHRPPTNQRTGERQQRNSTLWLGARLQDDASNASIDRPPLIIPAREGPITAPNPHARQPRSDMLVRVTRAHRPSCDQATTQGKATAMHAGTCCVSTRKLDTFGVP